MSGRNYERLMGREVEVVYNFHGQTKRVTGLVTGASYSIGLTIQNTQDKHYILCFNGPKSPIVLAKGSKHRFNRAKHRTVMPWVYDKIIKGKPLELRTLGLLASKCGHGSSGGPSAETCAFSQ